MANQVHHHDHHSVKVIEQCGVSPPPGSVPTTSLPLTILDIPWFYCHPVHRIFFYEFPHSTHHFLQTVLPTLKHSLSLTLQYFYPFASNLVFPPQPNIPYILYSHGDSVSFTVAESTKDFYHLIAATPRDVRDLHPFVPMLPSSRTLEDGTSLFPLMAIQVTVLPTSGFSICLNFRHVAADGRAIHHFMKFWASLYKTGENMAALDGSLALPWHNRDIIEDPKGLKHIYLEDVWNHASKSMDCKDLVHDVTIERFRHTYSFSRDQVEKMKKWVSFQCKRYNSGTFHISTFVVVCSLMWVCKEKSEDSNVNIVHNDDEICKLGFFGDCRNRPELSIPSTYFGNCLVLCVVSLERSKLMGENGIVEAAIAIENRVRDFQHEPFKGAEGTMSDFRELVKPGQQSVTIAASPKFGVYETDFGWGKPKKSEVLHIEYTGSISLSDHRENKGRVETVLVLERTPTNKFNTILEEQLRNIAVSE